MNNENLINSAFGSADKCIKSQLVSSAAVVTSFGATVAASVGLFWLTLNRLNFFDIQVAILTVIFAALASFLSAVFRDFTAKRALIAQSLVGDVIQNLIRESSQTFGNPDEKQQLGDVELFLKSKLRQLESSADLPLVPGRFGPLIYFIGSLAVAGYALSFAFDAIRS